MSKKTIEMVTRCMTKSDRDCWATQTLIEKEIDTEMFTNFKEREVFYCT